MFGRLTGSIEVAASTKGASRLMSTGLWKRRPGAVQRRELALFVHREHQRPIRRIKVETDDINQLGFEIGIVGQLEADAVSARRPAGFSGRC